MCGPGPCKAPTPCGRCERGVAASAAIEATPRHQMDLVASPERASQSEDRVTRVLRVMPTTSD
jgi:hypothetical protein